MNEEHADDSPPGWSWAYIGELAEATVSQGGPTAPGAFTYVDISSVDNKTKRITDPRRLELESAPTRARQRLRPGDVLVSMTRPNLNAVALVPGDLAGSVGSTGFLVLRPTGIDPRWLYYFVQTNAFVLSLSARVQGALYPAVRAKDILAHPIPVAPLEEQRRIVEGIEERFSRLGAAVAALTHVRANLNRYRSSILNAACDASLNGHDAGDWPRQKVGDLLEVLDYGTSSKTGDFSPGVPVLRMGNLKDGMIDLSDLKYLPANHAEFPKLLLRDGDLLFNRTNSPDLVGKTAVYRGHPNPCSFASYLIRARVRQVLLPDFLSYCTNSALGRSWVKSVVSQQVGQANVSGTKFRNFMIPVPPLEEQRQIVTEVERMLSLAVGIQSEVDAGLARCTALRHSILKVSFDGRLVPQDSNDEPALALLGRIRSCRGSAAPHGREATLAV